MRSENYLLFAIMGTRCHPDRPGPEQGSTQLLAIASNFRVRMHIKFDVTGHGRAHRTRSKFKETISVRLALRRDNNTVRQGLADQRQQSSISWQGAR
jgi:hypothetical protein